MINISYGKKFKKDFDKYKKKLRFEELEILFYVIKLLQNKEKLDLKFRDHSLGGNYKDFRECHIKPDLLLIYTASETELILTRLGSHAELFE